MRWKGGLRFSFCDVRSGSKMSFLCLRLRSSELPGANGAVSCPRRITCCPKSRQKPFCCPCLHDETLLLCRCCLRVAAESLALSPEGRPSRQDYLFELDKGPKPWVDLQNQPPRQPGKERHKPLELKRKRPEVMEAVNLWKVSAIDIKPTASATPPCQKRPD